MTIWFTSDNHFSHKNIHKFCPATRPDADVAIMNQKMIQKWQKQVRPDDEVWALGDFFFCGASEAKEILRALPGKIHLVYGNHDKTIRNAPDLQAMFQSIQEYKELRTKQGTFILFHYPIHEWDMMHRGAIHLYGHIHHAVSGVPGKTLNVCIDTPEMDSKEPYSLFSAEEVVRVANRKSPRDFNAKVLP